MAFLQKERETQANQDVRPDQYSLAQALIALIMGVFFKWMFMNVYLWMAHKNMLF